MRLTAAAAVLAVIGAAAASLATLATSTNVVIILVDDLGHGGLETNNPYVKGPKVTALREEGVYLERHYVYKFCSPTRGSLLSGRYPFRLGNTRSNFIPWSRPDGLNTGFDTLPLRLKRLGYGTHHVGKWHLGFWNASSLMPTSRGFDTFFGYLAGMQDHFTQELGGMIKCGNVVDLTRNANAAHGENGTYSGELYNSEAVKIATTATEPFFLNYWMQNTHAPFEVPPEYSSLYNFPIPALNTFNGMVSVVDEAVGNLTAALKNRGVWNRTVVVYTHDNGAPLGGGGSNFPFRGGKNSNFEGGVRVPAIVAGGAVPQWRHNVTISTRFHVSDWLPTLLTAIGHPTQLTDSVSATIPYDGIQQWEAIVGTPAVATRSEIILDHCLADFTYEGTGCNHYGVKGQLVGALISGEMKLVVGPNGGEWTNYTNGTESNSFNNPGCGGSPCLFNLSNDASEHINLAQELPTVLQTMLARFNALKSTYHPPQYNPPAEDALTCAAAAANGNFLSPWDAVTPPPPGPVPPTPPPPPPGPLGPCTGGPGDSGWEVLNGTGGGGPGFTNTPVPDLSEASVDLCRQRCCKTDKCVSVVLHVVNAGDVRCYLNPADGTVAPYARPDTLLAFVRRAQ